MAFFNSAVTVLQTLVIALGAGLGIWGAINLLEGYGNESQMCIRDSPLIAFSAGFLPLRSNLFQFQAHIVSFPDE